MMLPIHMMYRGFRSNPTGEALVDGPLRLTYLQLVQRVEAVASFLQETIPVPQSRIGICAYNNWQHLIAILGVYASGHTWVPLNPRNSQNDLASIAALLDLAIVDETCLPALAETSRPVVLASAVGNSLVSIAAICESYAGRRPRDVSHVADGIAAIKFTGGTTGSPKGVLQPYRAILNYIASMYTVFGFDGDERLLSVAPLTHGASTLLLPILGCGGCNIVLDGTKAKAPAIAEVMNSERITASFMPPTLIYALLDHAQSTGIRFPHLRNLIYGAAPMAPARIHQALELLGPRLGAIYGQAEAPMMISAISPRELAEPANQLSVGRPCPYNEVQLMAPDGRLLPAGETGEVVLRGDLVMRGYLDRPGLTQQTIIDGWLHTGDLGVFDERGYLSLKGRIRDVIISGGFNVYPADVEAALAVHPAVREAVVFARPDDYWGERVEAAIVLAAGAKAAPAELIAFAKTKVGSIRAPKAIHFLPRMPVNSVGKVARRDVLQTVDDYEQKAALSITTNR
jgi:acyl-CoA synthetase (AMP-forming)/AMP-acid ligase II